MATKTLLDVRDRVRATANITANRIADERLTEIVNDAVAEIASSGRLRFAEKSLTVILTDGVNAYQPEDSEGVLEKPVLWLTTNPNTNEPHEIKQVTLEGWRTSFTDPQTLAAGLPRVYTVWGESNEQPVLRVFPTPTGADLTTTLDCRIKFNELEDDEDTNSLITGAYDAVTYLTLMLAAPYLENDDRLDTWDRAYMRAFRRLMGSHASARYSGSARRQMREPG